MRLPRIRSEIERRLLVNYRADPEVVAPLLPAPFRPQLAGDAAVVGICLIRLGGTRPIGLPRWIGLRSENAAHRIAVEWDGPNGVQAGVFIPRRDSGSRATVILGGRVFPGAHHRAVFRVSETPTKLDVAFSATDGSVEVDVSVRIADDMQGRIFPDLESASRFFEGGADGFSPTRDGSGYEGLRLVSSAWKVEPCIVERARSSFYEDPKLFPAGSVELDHALVMRRIPVQWRTLDRMTSAA
ncbi:MAG TPA: hypothetical protein DGG94_03825 [Micromonosporaceae bacterium]|nr:hypothetical protein [Micromonosporaceae bacterium]HCU48928.1 hypothetical protein [Micromonosporaceae bacterium]